MTANVASLVNQQLYHAQLLINMIDEQDAQALHFRAAKQALINAAVQAVFLAYQGFLDETAQSCQLAGVYHSVSELDAALSEQGCSHAIVSNLKNLLQDVSYAEASWLQRLLAAQSAVLSVVPAKPAPANQPQLIIQTNQSDGIDTHDILNILSDLTAFIDVQRAYLQEW
ncbi:MAG: hypothetical protein KAG18_05780 [Sinobacterium sp.]|nr:hypothetical protein [Sinobacterium sp.]